MAYRSAPDGGYAAPASVIHPDAAHPDSISIPDAELLFRGKFHSAGPDLILTGHDGQRHIIPDYFSGAHHPALVAPNGARLSADMVELLTGPRSPEHYAQAQTQPSPSADAIGRVEKVVGIVTAVRNGAAVTLHVGDAIFKNDVVQTASDSSCGIGFPDGTALNIIANTRMALNDYAFDSNSTSNTALFTLVEGTFAFVAGQVAHTGNMRIATPVATMGIRGTTGILGTSALGEVVFVLQDDYHTNHHGLLELIEFGIFINDTNTATYCTANGCRTEPLTAAQIAEYQQLTEQLGQILNLLNVPNPQLNPSPGSGDNPNLLLPILQLFEENGGQPVFINVTFNGGINFVTPPFNFGTPPAQSGGNTNTPNVPANSSNIFIWSSGSPASWSQQLADWNQGAAPNLPGDTVIIQSGTSTYDLSGNTTIGFLTVDPGATLDIVSGQLTAGGLLDNGTIVVSGDPPALVIDGQTTIGPAGLAEVTGRGDEIEYNGQVFNYGAMRAENGGELLFDGTVVNEPGDMRGTAGHIVVTGRHSSAVFEDDVFNSGTIAARDGGQVSFDGIAVDNYPADELGPDQVAGRIVARGNVSRIDFSGGTVTNGGLILATERGIVVLSDGSILHNAGILDAREDGRIEIEDSAVGNSGTIEADGRGSQVALEQDRIDNSGGIEAKYGGMVSIDHSHIDNTWGGTIEADGRGSRITFDGDRIDNSGRIEAKYGGTVSIDNSRIDNARDGKIEAAGRGSKVEFDRDQINNWSSIAASWGGVILFDHSFIDNTWDGTIEADGRGSRVTLDQDRIDNSGGIEAKYGGTVSIDHSHIDNTWGGTIEADGWGSQVTLERDRIDNSGGIEAKYGGTVSIDHSHIDNTWGGTIEADGWGSRIAFDGDRIDNSGGIAAEHDGSIRFTGSKVFNDGAGAEIEAADGGSIVFCFDEITNKDGAKIGASDGGTIAFDRGDVTNAYHGTIEATDHGVITFDHADVTNQHNSTIEAADRGTVIFDHAHVTNEGHSVIEALSHGTIELEHSFVSNRDGLIAAFGYDAKVELADSFIAGGTLASGGGGVIETVYASSTLDHVTIASDSYVEVDSCTTLTLAGGSEMDRGTLCIDCSGTLAVESWLGATLDGVTVWNSGDIQVDSFAPATLTLEGGTDIHDGALYIGCFGTVDIETCFGATLDGVTVWNSGDIQVDSFAPATLTLEGGTDINGGALSIGCLGTVDVEGSGATFEGVNVDVTGDGVINVGLSEMAFFSEDYHHTGTILTLDDGTTITGGDLDIYNAAELAIDRGSGPQHGATLDGVDVTADGSIDVASGAVFTLDDGTTINGGNLSIGRNGKVQVDSGCNGGATFNGVTVTDDGPLDIGTLAIAAVLTFEGGTTVDGESAGTLTIAHDSALDIESRAGATLHHVSVTDDGTIAVDPGNATLTLDDGTTISGDGTLSAGNDGTVTLDDVTLSGITLKTSGSGIIESSGGDSTLSAVMIDGGTVLDATHDTSISLEGSTTLTGKVTFEGGGTFELDGTTTSSGTIAADDAKFVAESGTDSHIDSAVTGESSFTIDRGATLEFGGSVSAGTTVAFASNGYGELIIDNVKNFAGSISGFAGSDTTGTPSLASTDEIDLVGITKGDVSFSNDHGNAEITIKNNAGGTIATITIDNFNYHDLAKASDGSGGTIIFDPPAATSSAPSVSINGAGNDTFVFHPGLGAETAANFNAAHDAIELDNFANIHSVQQLAAAVTTDGDGDTGIGLGHHDSSAIAGVAANHLQAHLQNMVHLN